MLGDRLPRNGQMAVHDQPCCQFIQRHFLAFGQFINDPLRVESTRASISNDFPNIPFLNKKRPLSSARWEGLIAVGQVLIGFS